MENLRSKYSRAKKLEAVLGRVFDKAFQRYTGKQQIGKPFMTPSGIWYIIDEHSHRPHRWSPDQGMSQPQMGGQIKPSPFSAVGSGPAKQNRTPRDLNSKQSQRRLTRKQQKEGYLKPATSDIDRLEIAAMDDREVLPILADAYEEAGDNDTAHKVRDWYTGRGQANQLIAKVPGIVGNWIFDAIPEQIDEDQLDYFAEEAGVSSEEAKRGIDWLFDQVNRKPANAKEAAIDELRDDANLLAGNWQGYIHNPEEINEQAGLLIGSDDVDHAIEVAELLRDRVAELDPKGLSEMQQRSQQQDQDNLNIMINKLRKVKDDK